MRAIYIHCTHISHVHGDAALGGFWFKEHARGTREVYVCVCMLTLEAEMLSPRRVLPAPGVCEGEGSPGVCEGEGCLLLSPGRCPPPVLPRDGALLSSLPGAAPYVGTSGRRPSYHGGALQNANTLRLGTQNLSHPLSISRQVIADYNKCSQMDAAKRGDVNGEI